MTQILLYLLPIFITNSYTGLLPFVATNKLHVGSELYGVLQAAPGAGSMVAILVLASLVDFRHKRRILLWGGIIQGLFVILFAFSSLYLLSVLFLIFIGGTNTTFMALNNTVIQELLPDKIRGRVMSLREIAFGLGPAGSLASGAVAGLLGVTPALGLAGGVYMIILLGILLALPRAPE